MAVMDLDKMTGRPGSATPPTEPWARRARKLVRGRWLLLTLLVLAAAGVMVGLGVWQFQRLTTRRAINATIAERRAAPPVVLGAGPADATSLAERQVIATGTWDYANEVVLRPRAYQELPGVHVLTPLRLDGSDRAVLVDRGWVPYQQADLEQRREFQRDTRGEVRGFAHPTRGKSAPTGLPGAAPHTDSWSSVDLAAIQGQIPYPLLPVWMELRPVPGSRELPIPDPNLALDDGPHLGYTIQWWGFAVTLLVAYVVATTQDPAKRQLRPPIRAPRATSPPR